MNPSEAGDTATLDPPEATDGAAPDPDATAGAAASSTSPELRKIRVLTFWVSESSRQRLLDSFDYELLEGMPHAADADLVVLSTRMPRGHAPGLLGELREVADCPVVAITHAGGEAVAVEFMRAGATGVLAEGNEESLRAFLGGQGSDSRLVEAYDHRIGRSRVQDTSGRSRDLITGLPSLSAFEARITELGQTGTLPRVGLVEVVNLEDASRRLSLEAVGVLRRRLAVLFRELCREAGADLYSLSSAQFAFVAVGMTPEECHRLGWQLVRVTETFSPSGSYALALALGHAGPEVASEVGTLRELAQRALDLAGSQRESTVVSADDLSRSLASTTELEAALQLVDAVETATGTPGHGLRTAELANGIARTMGFEGQDRTQIRLAGHLHDIGMIGIGPAESAVPAAEKGPGPDAGEGSYREHPLRSAAYLRISAGPDVAAAVRAHHEHWDGSGIPEGLEGEAIPFGARVVAVACALDTYLTETDPEGSERDMAAALEHVRSEAGTRFDPYVVEAASEFLEVAGDEAADDGESPDGDRGGDTAGRAVTYT